MNHNVVHTFKSMTSPVTSAVKAWAPVAAQWSIFAAISGGSAGALWLAGGRSLMNVYISSVAGGTAWSLLINNIMPNSGHRLAKRMGGRTEAPSWLETSVGSLASKAKLGSTPAIYIIPTKEPNAFCAGRGAGTVVAVTDGLLAKLSKQEVAAVVAHELGHARHHDVGRSMQTASMNAGLFTAFRLGWGIVKSELKGDSRKSKNDDDKDKEGSALVGGLMLMGVGAITSVSGNLIRLASSRTAEFAADNFAAELVGPTTLASALRKIHSEHGSGGAQKRDALEDTYSHMYFNNDADAVGRFMDVLRTHPHTDRRLEKLDNFGLELEAKSVKAAEAAKRGAFLEDFVLYSA